MTNSKAGIMEFHSCRVGIDRKVTLKLLSPQNKEVLTAHLGLDIPHCDISPLNPDSDRMQINWTNHASLDIQHTKLDNGHKYDLKWASVKSSKLTFSDGYDMKGAHWFGAGQVKSQKWPIGKWKRKPSAYVIGDSYADEYGGVLERYFLSSNGVAIFVEPDVPLFVGINGGGDQKLQLISKYESPYKSIDGSSGFMHYSIFQSSDVKSVHQIASSFVIPKPIAIPDEKVFKFPIWSTWAKYKKNINQSIVLKYADEIISKGFKGCQLEIDDDWTTSYGDMDFDSSKFPEPGLMVKELEKRGFRVTVWVHPFASPTSKAFKMNYWVSGMMKGVSIWWNGLGRSLDVTHPAAVAWYSQSLLQLREKYGVTSFKFDAGETNWLPKGFQTHKPFSNPNTYSQLYAELAYKLDSDVRCQEVRVGARTQHLPVFVRMMDKDSKWGYDNGLKTLIPHALTFSIIGYPFILPDMIGGNAYRTEHPNRELYIRWLQATTFLPVLQFSIAPWQYDEEVVRISQNMVQLHEEYSGLMIELANDCMKTGDPIVRPLWWIAPNDDRALTIDNEFLVGNDLLVAPVLEKGARSRSIYLPVGVWKDQLTNQLLGGGKWYDNYKADLADLPHFIRQNPETNNAPQGKKVPIVLINPLFAAGQKSNDAVDGAADLITIKRTTEFSVGDIETKQETETKENTKQETEKETTVQNPVKVENAIQETDGKETSLKDTDRKETTIQEIDSKENEHIEGQTGETVSNTQISQHSCDGADAVTSGLTEEFQTKTVLHEKRENETTELEENKTGYSEEEKDIVNEKSETKCEEVHILTEQVLPESKECTGDVDSAEQDIDAVQTTKL